MTRAFLGVEVTRIQEKQKHMSLKVESPVVTSKKQIYDSQSRHIIGSPGGTLSALKAAADIAEAASYREILKAD